MEKEIVIQRGSTFEYEVLWANATDFTYKAITAISLTFGPPRLTVTGHGIPPGWPVAITRVSGMRKINAENSPPSSRDYHTVKVIDANTIELNDVDATGFSAYASGGFVQFKTPIDFSGYAFRQDIKDKEGRCAAQPYHHYTNARRVEAAYRYRRDGHRSYRLEQRRHRPRGCQPDG